MRRGWILSCAFVALMIVGCGQDPLLLAGDDAVATGSSTESAVQELVFGPVVATRGTAAGTVAGAPTEWTFAVEHASLYRCEPTFRLIVTNGYSDGTGRVDAAWVFVDGALAIAPAAFRRRVPTVERDVTLAAGSVITARVGGAPGGRLEISVEGACLPWSTIVGTSFVPILQTSRMAESPQGNLVTDAMVAEYGSDFAFVNSGALRADLTRPAGAIDPPQFDENGRWNIALWDVYRVLPFGNVVTLAVVDGPTLRAILDNGVRQIGGGRFIQVAGLRIDYAIDPGVLPADNGGFPRGVIQNVAYWKHPVIADGTPVDLSASASYRIATIDYLASGGDGYPNLADRVVSYEALLLIAVKRYLLAHSPVNPQVEYRIVRML
jgi:hypothetical protein